MASSGQVGSSFRDQQARVQSPQSVISTGFRMHETWAARSRAAQRSINSAHSENSDSALEIFVHNRALLSQNTFLTAFPNSGLS